MTPRHDERGTIVGLPGRAMAAVPVPVPTGPQRVPSAARGSLVGTELLARYDVEAEIGDGGMATVYQARHKTIRKLVAVKVLKQSLDGVPDAVERFLLEAQVTSRITHENVVEVTDFGTTPDGVVFSVMELLKGETLHQLIRSQGSLEPKRASAMLQQICGALQAAHDLGIVHRDLKPENIFRTPRPSNPDFIKVLDFGVAKVSDSTLSDPDSGETHEAVARPRSTRMGYVVGTPEYLSPEQIRADSTLDSRVDVYAAGALLFEMLTGRTPYLAASMHEQLELHLHGPVPDPGTIVPSIPQDLRAVVRTAMAKDPGERFASMEAMRQALAAVDWGERSPSKSRARGWAVAATIVASLGIAVAAWWVQGGVGNTGGVADGVDMASGSLSGSVDVTVETQAVETGEPVVESEAGPVVPMPMPVEAAPVPPDAALDPAAAAAEPGPVQPVTTRKVRRKRRAEPAPQVVPAPTSKPAAPEADPAADSIFMTPRRTPAKAPANNTPFLE